jgi:hypothetical protein
MIFLSFSSLQCQLLSVALIGCISFCCCDKISDGYNLKGGRFILAHGFKGFSEWLASSIAFRPVSILAEECGGAKLLTLLVEWLKL